MRVFVTGASGFVGSAVVADLMAAGHAVTGLIRSSVSARALLSQGARAVTGDLHDLDAVSREARAADATIHTAFDHDFSRMVESCELDRRAIAAMGEAMAGSNKPFIVTAGLPVMAGRVATEDDPPPTGMPRVSEQTALALIDRGVRSMVIRMSQVHDAAKQGFASYLLDHAREKGVSAYVGEGRNRWPAVHRLDAARLYRLALENGVSGQRYHAVAEQGVPVREIAQVIGHGLRVPTVSLSAEAAPGHFGWLERIVRMDMPAASDATREALEWQPREPSGFLANLALAVAGPASTNLIRSS